MNFGLSFQKSKVNRLTQVNGQDFVFKRQKLNEFNEPISGGEEEIKVRGFYHEVSSYVTKTGNDSSTTRSKVQPMILCTVEEGSKIKKEDLLEFKGKKMKVVDLADVNELGICIDVSLEVIQDGQ